MEKLQPLEVEAAAPRLMAAKRFNVVLRFPIADFIGPGLIMVRFRQTPPITKTS
jgi:hypothetical protein